MRAACVWLCVLLMVSFMAASDRIDTPTSPPPASCGLGLHCGCPAVSSLLQAMGFSPACVASSLATCSHLQEENQVATFIEEVRETMHEVRGAITDLKARQTQPRHCQDLLSVGDSGRGRRQVYPFPERPQWAASVYCDHTVDGGGWTVFQHRTNATTREDFERTWLEYQRGFGRLEGEFWLGLDLLHALTSTSLQELRVDLADYEGGKRWAKYGVFSVGSAQDQYPLSIDRYTGDAGDGLSKGGHHGMKFSTPELDLDISESNCAASYRGAWWYAACHLSNLNGYQHQGQHEAYAEGINWQPWRGYHYSLMNTTMMTRPAF